MTARLENLTSRPVTVVLNSGAVVHLPPGHAVEPDPVEIEDNAKVRKLRDALVIAVAEPEEAGSGQADPDQAGSEAAEAEAAEAEPAEAGTEPVPAKPAQRSTAPTRSERSRAAGRASDDQQ
jgi:hypothetical protein